MNTSFLLRSQPSVLSYSILDNKHMVLFCCLKNVCWVIANICAPQSTALSRVPDTFGCAEVSVWTTNNVEAKKKKVVEPPEKQKPDPTALRGTFPRGMPRAEHGCAFVADGKRGDKERLWRLCNAFCWVRSSLSFNTLHSAVSPTRWLSSTSWAFILLVLPRGK